MVPGDVRTDWYQRHGCTHAHCPLGCDKPQPAERRDGNLYCSRCAVIDERETVMVPCTPDICED